MNGKKFYINGIEDNDITIKVPKITNVEVWEYLLSKEEVAQICKVPRIIREMTITDLRRLREGKYTIEELEAIKKGIEKMKNNKESKKEEIKTQRKRKIIFSTQE